MVAAQNYGKGRSFCDAIHTGLSYACLSYNMSHFRCSVRGANLVTIWEVFEKADALEVSGECFCGMSGKGELFRFDGKPCIRNTCSKSFMKAQKQKFH